MATQEATLIGKIVQANGHIDYVCQVNGPGEAEAPPAPKDHIFGTFVAVALEGGGELIGVVYNTMLMNPDFGATGPRLSPQQELEVFSPDYLAETATLLGIVTLGWRDAGGQFVQGVPARAAAANCAVYKLTESDVRGFHCDPDEQPCMRYVPHLLAQRNPLISPLLMNILDGLATHFPNSGRQLQVMRNNVAWKAIVQPAG